MNLKELKKYVENKLILLQYSLSEEENTQYYEHCNIVEQELEIARMRGEVDALTMVYILMDKEGDDEFI